MREKEVLIPVGRAIAKGQINIITISRYPGNREPQAL
jgi:hypothetical protein